MILFKEVKDKEHITTVSEVAKKIQLAYFTPITGEAQVLYMLHKFQSEETIQKQIKNGYIYELVYKNDNLAGYFGVKREKEKLFLSKFYLDSDFRGQGIGRKMMDKVIELGKDLKAVYLTVNKQNSGPIAVYKNLGFNIVDSVVTNIGDGFVMDDYVMEKEL